MFVEIGFDRTVHDVIDNLRAAVQPSNEIPECHLVAGDLNHLPWRKRPV